MLHFGYDYLQTAQEVTKSLILNRNHSTELALLLKHANSIVFVTFVQ